MFLKLRKSLQIQTVLLESKATQNKQKGAVPLGKELDSLDESMLCLSYTLVKADLRNN